MDTWMHWIEIKPIVQGPNGIGPEIRVSESESRMEPHSGTKTARSSKSIFYNGLLVFRPNSIV